MTPDLSGDLVVKTTSLSPVDHPAWATDLNSPEGTGAPPKQHARILTLTLLHLNAHTRARAQPLAP